MEQTVWAGFVATRPLSPDFWTSSQQYVMLGSLSSPSPVVGDDSHIQGPLLLSPACLSPRRPTPSSPPPPNLSPLSLPSTPASPLFLFNNYNIGFFGFGI